MDYSVYDLYIWPYLRQCAFKTEKRFCEDWSYPRGPLEGERAFWGAFGFGNTWHVWCSFKKIEAIKNHNQDTRYAGSLDVDCMPNEQRALGLQVYFGETDIYLLGRCCCQKHFTVLSSVLLKDTLAYKL